MVGRKRLQIHERARRRLAWKWTREKSGRVAREGGSLCLEKAACESQVRAWPQQGAQIRRMGSSARHHGASQPLFHNSGNSQDAGPRLEPSIESCVDLQELLCCSLTGEGKHTGSRHGSDSGCETETKSETSENVDVWHTTEQKPKVVRCKAVIGGRGGEAGIRRFLVNFQQASDRLSG